MNKLPDKPSALILLALSDLEKTEQDERYVIDMGHWHMRANRIDKCVVCWAGSVMAQTLETNRSCNVTPEDFDNDTCGKLGALESFRTGAIYAGLKEMGIPDSGIEDVYDVPFYQEYPARFKASMRSLADYLESQGL